MAIGLVVVGDRTVRLISAAACSERGGRRGSAAQAKCKLIFVAQRTLCRPSEKGGLVTGTIANDHVSDTRRPPDGTGRRGPNKVFARQRPRLRGSFGRRHDRARARSRSGHPRG